MNYKERKQLEERNVQFQKMMEEIQKGNNPNKEVLLTEVVTGPVPAQSNPYQK